MAYTVKTFVADTAESGSSDKRLSISLKTNGFSFTVFAGENHLLTYCDVETENDGTISSLSSDIKKLFTDKKLMIFGYSSAEVVACADLASWLPEHLYEKGRERQYLSMVGKVRDGYTCYSDYCELLKSYIVFSADSTAVSAFKITFPGIKVRCQYSKLVVPEFVRQTEPVLLLNLRSGFCDIVASFGGQLHISNSYASASVGDAMYKALNVMKSLSMESPDLTLWLCGDVDRDTFALFAKYFPHVRLYTGQPFTCQNDNLRNIHTYRDILVFG